MEEGRKPPVYESKVVQVYPSQYEEDEAIRLYESGCWELVSSNRCQETNYGMISTFTRLTFRRDKNMPHYAEIAEAFRELEYFQGKEGKSPKNVRTAGQVAFQGFVLCITFGISSILFSFMPAVLVAPIYGVIMAAAGVAFIILSVFFRKKQKKAKRAAIAAKEKADADFNKRKQAAFDKMAAVRKECGF